MRKTALVVLSLVLWAATAFAGDPGIRRNERRIPGQYIVVVQPGAEVGDVVDTVKTRGHGKVRHQFEQGLKGAAVDMTDADAQTLALDPRVAYVEEDSVIETSGYAWWLDRIDQRTMPLDGKFVPGHNGCNVRVYVFDTGVAPHDDLGSRLVPGYNAMGDTQGTVDCNGHGTHVAGIIAGKNYGIAEGARIVPVRVLDCKGKGSVSTLLAGIDWAINDKIKLGTVQSVANMSLTGYASSALDDAVNKLIDAGVTTVAAAGNNANSACNFSPARVARVLTVGATSQTDNQAVWSNYGACVDIFAPGVGILSTWITTTKSTNTLSGTSQATAVVSGVATLWAEGTTLTPEQIGLNILSHATINVITGLSDMATPNRLVSVFRGNDQVTTPVSQLIGDSSFGSGDAFWSGGICTVINQTNCPPGTFDLVSISMAGMPSHSGGTHASLGGKDRDVAIVSAPMTIPSNASAVELGFWLWVVTAEHGGTAQDILTVDVRDADGKVLATLGTFSNLDDTETYHRRYFDMTAYRGKTIRVAFTSAPDRNAPTWFLLDDVELNAWQ